MVSPILEKIRIQTFSLPAEWDYHFKEWLNVAILLTDSQLTITLL